MKEVVFITWGTVMFLVAYAMGNLQADLSHKVSHHGSVDDPCINAHLCSIVAPKSLCLSES